MEPKCILVIDDDEDMLDLVTAALEPTGATIDQAATRDEIIERLFQDCHYDLIITDVWMPWMSGLQVANVAQMVGGNVPILFISGFADPSLEERVRVYSGRLLRKPFDTKELLRITRELLDHGPEQRDAATT